MWCVFEGGNLDGNLSTSLTTSSTDGVLCGVARPSNRDVLIGIADGAYTHTPRARN